MTTLWAVVGQRGKPLGIVESNYAWAAAYWLKRGCRLRPIN